VAPSLQTVEILVYLTGLTSFFVWLAVAILTTRDQLNVKLPGRAIPPSPFQRRFGPTFHKINQVGAMVLAPAGLLLWTAWAAVQGDLLGLLEFLAVVASLIGGVRLAANIIPKALNWCWNRLDPRIRKVGERILFFGTMVALGLGLIPLLLFCGVPLLPFLLLRSARDFLWRHGRVSSWRRLRVVHESIPPEDIRGVNSEDLAKATTSLEALGFERLGDFTFQVRLDDETKPAAGLPPMVSRRRKRPAYGSATGFQRVFLQPEHGCICRLINTKFAWENGHSNTGWIDFRFESYAGTRATDWCYATDSGTQVRSEDPEATVFPHPRRLFTDLGFIDDLAAENVLRLHLDRRNAIAEAAGIMWDRRPTLVTLWASEERSAEYVRDVYQGLTQRTALLAGWQARGKPFLHRQGLWKKNLKDRPDIRSLNDFPRTEWMGELEGRV